MRAAEAYGYEHGAAGRPVPSGPRSIQEPGYEVSEADDGRLVPRLERSTFPTWLWPAYLRGHRTARAVRGGASRPGR